MAKSVRHCPWKGCKAEAPPGGHRDSNRRQRAGARARAGRVQGPAKALRLMRERRSIVAEDLAHFLQADGVRARLGQYE
eukprot:7232381-Lingulodinium_polyedra.AAC.1